MLACTFCHILADGTRITNSLADLGRAYRGESLRPLNRWLQRDLLGAHRIGELLPSGEELVAEARDAIKVMHRMQDIMAEDKKL